MGQVVKWGLLILLVLVGIVWVMSRILPTKGGKPKLLQDAKDGADKLKEAFSEKLEAHNAAMAAEKTELEEIKAIEDEEERLRRLADFANRKRRG